MTFIALLRRVPLPNLAAEWRYRHLGSTVHHARYSADLGHRLDRTSGDDATVVVVR